MKEKRKSPSRELSEKFSEFYYTDGFVKILAEYLKGELSETHRGIFLRKSSFSENYYLTQKKNFFSSCDLLEVYYGGPNDYRIYVLQNEKSLIDISEKTAKLINPDKIKVRLDFK